MTWNTHLNNICSKLRGLSCILYNCRHLMPFRIRKTILHALVYSSLRYGITVYYHCSNTWRLKINSILKNILRSVSYNITIPNDRTLFSALHLPSFDALFLQTVISTHFWGSDFLVHHVPARPLRYHSQFEIPRCFTRFGRFVRKYYVPASFNSLPRDIFSVQSKRSLKLFMRENLY